MYVAVKGGETAIANAHRWLARVRRGDTGVPELEIAQIREQLGRAVDRVMAEGSLYDPDLAALAIKQAQGDLIEAIFLMRAFRTTLPRFGYSQPLDTARLHIRRRISATFKDVPGGQILGPTMDYTHRLVDFGLEDESTPPSPEEREANAAAMARVTDLLGADGLVEAETADDPQRPVADVTRESTQYPCARDARLQQLARGDEGYLLALGYSTQRGYGRTHPFVGELRQGEVAVEFIPEELGFAIELGDLAITECQMINQFAGNAAAAPQFTRGYGLTFGYGERKAMSMALVDRALRAPELGEPTGAPAQDQEFVLYHADNVQATGFVEHLKLPHYVDFQSELVAIRELRKAFGQEDGQ